MGDMADDFRAMKEAAKARKAALGVPCPECIRLLPKADPTILLPGWRCQRRGHRYTDPRSPGSGEANDA